MSDTTAAARRSTGEPEDPRQRRDAVLVFNTQSRQGNSASRRVRQRLTDQGWTIAEEHLIEDPDRQLGSVLTKVAEQQPGLVILGSGDGTVAAMVNALAGSRTVLGYLPLGTTNNFARGLGLPLALDDALDVVLSGRLGRVDLGVASGPGHERRYFANMVAMGASARIAGEITNDVKRTLGRLAYPITGARTMLHHKAFSAEVTSGSTIWRIRTHQLNVSNAGQYAGSAIAADVGPQDGLLTAYALGGAWRITTVLSAARQVLTSWETVERKGHLLGADFAIRTDRPVEIEMDGESFGTTPVNLAVAPGALRVVLPTR